MCGNHGVGDDLSEVGEMTIGGQEFWLAVERGSIG